GAQACDGPGGQRARGGRVQRRRTGLASRRPARPGCPAPGVGGPDQVGTLALVPQIVSVVMAPVVAAGGIADARGDRAALALGAAGVQVAPAYLLCPEATTGAVHRAALKSDAARHTALTNVFTGRPARLIANRIMKEVGPISAAAPAFPSAAS